MVRIAIFLASWILLGFLLAPAASPNRGNQTKARATPATKLATQEISAALDAKQQAIARHGAQVVAHPEVAKRLRGLGAQDREKELTRLAAAGRSRVSDEFARDRIRLVARVLDLTSEAGCVGVLGRIRPGGDEAFNKATLLLSLDDFTGYLAYLEEAILAAAQGRPEKTPSIQDTREAILAIEQSLQGAERVRFMTASKQSNTLSDSDFCWLAKTIYTKGQSLRGRQLDVLARAF